MKQSLLIVIYLLSILSCTQEVVKNETSYAYSISVGSKFVLNKEIEIKPNLGRLIPYRNKHKQFHQPHLKLSKL